jgi:DNA-binding LacI/PurR family transcriptional regulator
MTLFDLAKELNVSISTISRALSRPEIVAPATRERVLAAVKEFGFQPNGIARSLRTQETRTIGIIVPDITNSFFGVIVKAVGEVAKVHDYTVIICNANEDPADEAQALEVLRARKVSGVINCPIGANLDLWRVLIKAGVPLVELDRRSGLKNIDNVTFDDEKAAEQATEHLIKLGHQRIATIAGPRHLSNATARVAGYQKALLKSDIRLHPEYIEEGDFGGKSGHVAMEKLLSLRRPPTAIFVANSEMTGGAMGVLREKNIRVPNELSVVGFFDARWAGYLDPPLTMIDHPAEEMGKCAAELLIAQMEASSEHRVSKTIVFPPKLIIRNSTAKIEKSKNDWVKPRKQIKES